MAGPARTFNTDKLKELAEAGRSAREIATEMGISRQRVYAVAAREGVVLPKGLGRPGARGPKKQVSRIRTGGIDHLANSATSGRICELLVAADLMARGWKVFFPLNGRGAHDVVGAKEGELRSFEVRAASRNASGTISFREDKGRRSDHYALVIRGETVKYVPDL